MNLLDQVADWNAFAVRSRLKIEALRSKIGNLKFEGATISVFGAFGTKRSVLINACGLDGGKGDFFLHGQFAVETWEADEQPRT